LGELAPAGCLSLPLLATAAPLLLPFQLAAHSRRDPQFGAPPHAIDLAVEMRGQAASQEVV